MNYLKPNRIVQTISTLENRINDRFPNSGLSKVCADLLAVAQKAEQKTQWFGQPVRWLRALAWLISLLIVIGSIGTLALLGDETSGLGMGFGQPKEVATEPPTNSADNGLSDTKVNSGSGDDAKQNRPGLAELIQILEAGINDIVLIGAAIFFLMTLETRYKRGRALEAIHELRSIAHIIDMHQLTKDPERTTSKTYLRTRHSPHGYMTRFQLRRYLDYCSEMLSLAGKIAAVYVQEFNDSVALASANEVETLCTGLSRKIWQKVSILHDDDLDSEESHPVETPTPPTEPAVTPDNTKSPEDKGS